MCLGGQLCRRHPHPRDGRRGRKSGTELRKRGSPKIWPGLATQGLQWGPQIGPIGADAVEPNFGVTSGMRRVRRGLLRDLSLGSAGGRYVREQLETMMQRPCGPEEQDRRAGASGAGDALAEQPHHKGRGGGPQFHRGVSEDPRPVDRFTRCCSTSVLGVRRQACRKMWPSSPKSARTRDKSGHNEPRSAHGHQVGQSWADTSVEVGPPSAKFGHLQPDIDQMWSGDSRAWSVMSGHAALRGMPVPGRRKQKREEIREAREE